MPTGSKTSRPGKRAPGPKPVSLAADEAGDAKAARKGAGKSGQAKGAVVKLKDLVEQVTEDSGVGKKDAKAVVEAVMARIGAALGRGESLNLQGLGHLRVARKATADSPVMTLKLRPADAGKPPSISAPEDEKDTLAEDSDQG